MTKAFPNIARRLQNAGTRLLKMINRIIDRLTANLKRYFRGITADVRSPLSTPVYSPRRLAGPAHNLGGGGPDVEEAIQWMINQVRGNSNYDNKVNVLVIRGAGDDNYNQLIYGMKGVKYVETLVISNREQANRTDVFDRVRNADVIFFAGGDQCQYIRTWKNTKLEVAIKSVYDKGGAVGGTSAGAMIQSDYIYDSCACIDSIEGREALEDPYKNITFTYNFFQWKTLRNTIIDTHFDRRQRMGRIMVFIARQIQDGVSKSVLGIAVSEETSIVVDKYGLAKVMGRGAVYFVLGDHPPVVCQPGSPLTYHDYKIWRVTRGDTFNLVNLPTKGYYLRSVKRGRLDSDLY
ncbi:Type 1 glutamine amidotransferase-like domain-containing protein [Cronbergia sp. UHCC 0137]|uniref:cyanophycinase n=1 Tax=Cronbergia sp. UHCC 0137 TaxID=3110239 RepID=UPI002B21C5F3|nr:Type 1 glutamine amidotransferase-like domain-containing protein [Cronbergia sp. UHCC 0137]MEA5617479.1 Type 1 glutamine amidotransferase-like domain-containing protein [Cronbergia sp. UHCC 0137]